MDESLAAKAIRIVWGECRAELVYFKNLMYRLYSMLSLKEKAKSDLSTDPVLE